MLNVMRKYAGTWLIKMILALIILSFILFFGYTRIQSRYAEGQRFVAGVGSYPIPRQKFDLLYQERLGPLRESFKGEIPENFEKMFRDNLLNQLVAREIHVLFAESLGLYSSDEELADRIQKNLKPNSGGVFDLHFYQNTFRPRYQNQTGEDYEEALRKEVSLEKLDRLADSCFGPWEKELSKSLATIQTKKKKEQPPVETAAANSLLSPWVDQFREKIRIEFYRNPS